MRDSYDIRDSHSTYRTVNYYYKSMPCKVENRTDKRPQLSDLRESGSIEQDADIVLFVYREEYYLKNEEPKESTAEYNKWQEAMEQAKGKAEVIIAKQRHGPTGIVPLAFQPDFTCFSDLEK